MIFENEPEYFVEKILFKNMVKKYNGEIEYTDEYMKAFRLLTDYQENIRYVKNTEQLINILNKGIENRKQKIREIEEEAKKL